MSVEDFEDTEEFDDDQGDFISRHQIEDYPDDAADENSKLQFTSANSSSTDVALVPPPTQSQKQAKGYKTTGRTGMNEQQLLSMATSKRRKIDDDIARESRAISGDQDFLRQYIIMEREREDRRDERMRLEQKEREERDRREREERDQRAQEKEERERRERDERDQRFNALLMALIQSKRD